ncbi:TIGR01212 family radical SAM protein [Celerinatantimonas diazotrophica]|uniref:Radical SAM core domain-containing protein n=1 Tax=Celerinatantimonas diazotrophica TaxID=412034 RepID=A0A4R1JA18_9GAMM|nr:TIGR01212 family radical SAM protein [Celerinatantimonas diazotrophica]TCK46949.1 hypothetical protein EV690_3101 [Celerinatantimonas diazotrophica]CAG9295717.1 tRNA-2-methylthio-N(6)-dimethylallyladenosine synthase [Celerinatantimonas diazotrophica]
MQLTDFVHTIGSYFRSRYATRVRKLTIDAQFTCPNRDGTIGRGGCTFCNVDSFTAAVPSDLSIAEQLSQRKAEMKHQDILYLAYFQAYTSTYGEYQKLYQLYQQALNVPQVIGICVGTRPDCVSDEVLQLLSDYQRQGKEVWLELGLQSANARTLKRINRGHDYSAYQRVVEKAHRYQIKVCTHLILGLPGEGPDDYANTLQQVLSDGVSGLKLHPLMVVQGSVMAKAWQAGRLSTLSLDEYVKNAAMLIEQTPWDVVFHRVCATARPPMLLSPNWCAQQWPPLTAIGNYLSKYGKQGSGLSSKV